MKSLGPGSVLLDQYCLLSELGEGGFARVFRAVDKSLNREVAVKVIKESTLLNTDIARFEREATVLAQLSHPNIITVNRYVPATESNPPFLIMEYLEGKSLKEILNGEKLEDSLATKIVHQICNGLSYAHKLGVVHRDLSTANIFVEGKGSQINVKILDFGLCRLFAGELPMIQTLTETGFLVGNPAYMCPEFMRNTRVDGRADIYAIGCIIYECLTGQLAFQSDSPMTQLYMHEHSYPKEPEVSSAEGKKLAAIAIRSLQKDPANRFQNCDEISNCLQDELAETQLYKLNRKLEQWSHTTTLEERRNTVLLPLILAATLLIIGGVTYLTVSGELQCMQAKYSLQENSSEANLKHWLYIAFELEQEGKKPQAQRLAEQVLHRSRDNLQAAMLYNSIAREALESNKMQSAYRLATKALLIISDSNQKYTRQRISTKLEAALDEAAAIILSTHIKPDKELSDALSTIIAKPNLFDIGIANGKSIFLNLVARVANKMRKSVEVVDALKARAFAGLSLSKDEYINTAQTIIDFEETLSGHDIANTAQLYAVLARQILLKEKEPSPDQKKIAKYFLTKCISLLPACRLADKNKLLQTYSNLAETYASLSRPEIAEKYQQEAMKAAMELDAVARAQVYLTRINFLIGNHRYDEAMQVARTSVQTLKTEGVSRWNPGELNIRSSSVCHYISLLMKIGKREEAMHVINEEITFLKELSSPSWDYQVRFLILKSEIERQSGKPELCLKDLESAREAAANENSSLQSQINTLLKLIEFHLEMHNWNEADKVIIELCSLEIPTNCHLHDSVVAAHDMRSVLNESEKCQQRSKLLSWIARLEEKSD